MDFELENAIRKAIKEHIVSEGIKQSDVAAHMGVARSNITEFLNCHTKTFTVQTLTRVLDAVGLQPVLSFESKE